MFRWWACQWEKPWLRDWKKRGRGRAVFGSRTTHVTGAAPLCVSHTVWHESSYIHTITALTKLCLQTFRAHDSKFRVRPTVLGFKTALCKWHHRNSLKYTQNIFLRMIFCPLFLRSHTLSRYFTYDSVLYCEDFEDCGNHLIWENLHFYSYIIIHNIILIIF